MKTARSPCVLVLLALLAGCVKSPSGGEAATVESMVAVESSIAVSSGAASGAVLWLHPSDADRSVMIGALGEAGLAVFAPDGYSVDSYTGGDFDFIALTYGFDAGSGAGAGALLVAHDRSTSALRGFTIDPASRSLRELGASSMLVQDEVTGLCLYRSGLTGKIYAFAATDSGQLQQWELAMQRGVLTGRIVRNIAIGAGSGYCVTDDREQLVYIADEAIGIWRIVAEPEANVARQLLDQTAPRGKLGEEVKGLALYRTQGAQFLLAADEDAASVHVYDLPAGAHLGQFRLADVAGPKFESIWAGPHALAPEHEGAVLVADQSREGAAFRVLSWSAVSTALGLGSTAPVDPRVVPPVAAITVEPTVATEPVEDYGDAADDPAIWIHPTNPSRSLVIGAQKKRGLEVYDLSGRRIQVLATGRINNVDLRQDVQLGGRRRDVVAGSNRTDRTLSLFEVNAATRRVTPAAAAPIPSGFGYPYGLCMYHSARTGKLHVFMNDSGSGDFRQWEIGAEPAGLTATLVREFAVGSQAEGCVADDETGALYIAEEDVGLWRYAAEPDGGNDRRMIDSTGKGGNLTADVEGVALFIGRDGAGYLIASNQGADNYAVYRREGDNAFIGMFSIVANDELGIDGASETDGLEVTSKPLGPAFPAGLLVVQDGRNISPDERQNFKLVPWERVAQALGLD